MQINSLILYWAAFAIPLTIVFVGALADKLIEKEPFQWKHFYLGIELTLSALATGLVNILDILKEKDFRPITIVTTLMFVVFCILCLLGLLGIHQEWQGPEKKGRSQIFRLGVASNLVGGVLLTAFVEMKMRGFL